MNYKRAHWFPMGRDTVIILETRFRAAVTVPHDRKRWLSIYSARRDDNVTFFSAAQEKRPQQRLPIFFIHLATEYFSCTAACEYTARTIGKSIGNNATSFFSGFCSAMHSFLSLLPFRGRNVFLPDYLRQIGTARTWPPPRAEHINR